MKEIKIYIANDGTEFRTKDDCIAYESGFSKIYRNDNIIFFDTNLNKLKKPIFAEDWDSLIRKSWYIFINSEESFESVRDLFTDTGHIFNYDTSVDSVLGLWHYNAEHVEWENLTCISNVINEILRKVSNEIEDK